MPAGASLFETCEWAGRFWQQAVHCGMDWHWLTRIEVKAALCNSARAKDANVRAALIDRFGGKAATKKGGVLHGISGDCWSALAVAVVWQDQQRAK